VAPLTENAKPNAMPFRRGPLLAVAERSAEGQVWNVENWRQLSTFQTWPRPLMTDSRMSKSGGRSGDLTTRGCPINSPSSHYVPLKLGPALKRGARSAADDGAPGLYTSLFGRPNRPNKKPAKPVPAPPVSTPPLPAPPVVNAA
jgi:hypothetical protein